MEISGAEECTHRRREGRRTLTSIAGCVCVCVCGGGGFNKIWKQKITTSRAFVKRWGREFSPATFIGKQKENVPKRNP